MRGWLTPDTIPVSRVCRTLRIPDSIEFIAPVTGAILSLTAAYNWEKYGALTPEETAAVYDGMLNQMLNDGLSNCMIGVIFPYMTENPPGGALICDGRTLSRTDYPLLYSASDPVFIVDADTFVLPDLRSRSVVGAGEGTGLSPYTVGQEIGEEKHVLTVSELASHSHTDAGHTHSEIAAIATSIPPGEIPIPLPSAIPSPSSTGAGFASIQSTGDSEAHENRPPELALNWGVWWR